LGKGKKEKREGGGEKLTFNYNLPGVKNVVRGGGGEGNSRDFLGGEGPRGGGLIDVLIPPEEKKKRRRGR